jgi:hypothetical protein
VLGVYRLKVKTSIANRYLEFRLVKSMIRYKSCSSDSKELFVGGTNGVMQKTGEANAVMKIESGQCEW